MINHDIELKFEEGSVAGAKETIYQFRIDFIQELTETDMDAVTGLMDSISHPYHIIVFIQLGTTFVEGFFEIVDRKYEDSTFMELMQEAIRQLGYKVNKATLTKINHPVIES